MKTHIFLLLSLFITTSAYSQILRGKITDSAGNVVPGATLFIKEKSLGLVANTDGTYQVYLDKGTYDIEFRSLGYETLDTTIIVSGKETVKNIQLQRRTYMLQEVRVGSKNEDPAYYIIRRAIAMAPYYRNYIKSYAYETYLKGKFRIEKLPRIGDYTVEDVDMKKYIGKDLMVESIADISYTAPNQFKLDIKAYKSSLPSALDSALSISVSDGSIYKEKLLGCLSPLSSKALDYYKFMYLGSQEDGNHLINKIQVTPKKRNAQLLEGTIYINEDTWDVVHVDLISSSFGIDFRHKWYYTEIKPNVFVVTSKSSELLANVLGLFKGSGSNYVSCKYSKLELNKNLPKPDMIKLPQQSGQKTLPDIPVSETEKKIEKLTSKESLSNKETYQLAQLLQKTMADSTAQKKKRSLELKKEGNLIIDRKTDSLAYRRDSVYWEKNRVIPLKPSEIQSYLSGDSLKIKIDSIQLQKSTRNKKEEEGIDLFSKITNGDKIYFSEKKYYLSYSGLGGISPEYNFVDGFWLGYHFGLGAKLSDKLSLDFAPAVYYVTARKAMTWFADLTLNYAPMSLGKLSIKAGDRSEDFNLENGTLHMENTFTSVLLGDSYIKFYRNKFFTIQNDIDIVNGLQLHLGLDYAQRSTMTNAITYSIFNNHTAEPNIPDNPYYQDMPVNYSLQTTIGISYTPEYYYRVWKGKKYYAHSSYPTFSVIYKRGINTGATYSPRFDQLEASISQQINLGLFDHFTYSLNTGKFISKDELYFPDFRHFNTDKLAVTGKTFTNGFRLLENYKYSTDDLWTQANLCYQSQYLLIKNIPYLQSKIFNEAVHLNYLYTPQNKNYIEAGYSLGLNELGRIGIFVGFDQFKYKAFGFSISLPLLKELEMKR